MTALAENNKKSLTNVCVAGSELKMGHENGTGLGVLFSSGLRCCVEELRHSVQSGHELSVDQGSPWHRSILTMGCRLRSRPGKSRGETSKQRWPRWSGVRGMGSADPRLSPRGRRRARREPRALRDAIPAARGEAGGARGPLPRRAGAAAGAAFQRIR